jgi:hypothetical protein
MGINVFGPYGLMSRLKATYVDQQADVPDSMGTLTRGGDRFWVVDGSVGYRLPGRFGLITVEAKNMFNQRFKFQDTDPASPSFIPERVVLGRIVLAF